MEIVKRGPILLAITPEDNGVCNLRLIKGEITFSLILTEVSLEITDDDQQSVAGLQVWQVVRRQGHQSQEGKVGEQQTPENEFSRDYCHFSL